MNPQVLCTEEEFKSLKGWRIPVMCAGCDSEYLVNKTSIRLAEEKGFKLYCTRGCSQRAQQKKVVTSCAHCGEEIVKTPYAISGKYNKSGRVFCNRSCAASYNNTHRTYGQTRSKLEVWLEEQLTSHCDFPVLFNDKSAIGSELDIFFPSLNLAFEVNGIWHYKPIRGQELLDRIQTNDAKKAKACKEKGIKLVEINCLDQSRFTVESSYKYLEQILEMVDGPGVSPGS